MLAVQTTEQQNMSSLIIGEVVYLDKEAAMGANIFSEMSAH